VTASGFTQSGTPTEERRWEGEEKWLLAETASIPLLATPSRIRTASLPASPARTRLRSLSLPELEVKADEGGLSDELMV
jgi:hypothetical protein